MSTLVKVTGTNFIRDTRSMALINQNTSEKNEYIAKVHLLNAQKRELNIMKAELEEIKGDMREIKTLLQTLTQSKV